MGIVLLIGVGRWRSHHLARATESHLSMDHAPTLPRKSVVKAIAVLAALTFSKYFYLASMIGYFTFYLIARFHLDVRSSQLHLFVFLGAVAAGTLLGGPIGDRIGPQVCHLGIDPRRAAFHADASLSQPVLDGDSFGDYRVRIASAFPAIVVYAQELMPGRVGWFPASSSDRRSGWAASARRCWDTSRT